MNTRSQRPNNSYVTSKCSIRWICVAHLVHIQFYSHPGVGGGRTRKGSRDGPQALSELPEPPLEEFSGRSKEEARRATTPFATAGVKLQAASHIFGSVLLSSPLIDFHMHSHAHVRLY